MTSTNPAKSTIDEIRQRFDNAVDHFSNLETGQSSVIDAPLVLELISEAAAGVNPQAKRLLDVGCGAGNYTLKLLTRLPKLDVTLVDLSRPMLDRAQERIRAADAGSVRAIQGDIREVELGEGQFDVIVSSAVLHHLRTDAEWEAVFAKLHRALDPGGSWWIFDLIAASLPSVQKSMDRRFAEYLESIGGPEYRQKVVEYVDYEDTPRPLTYQIELLRSTGFRTIEVLHMNGPFAAFGAVK